MGRPERGRGDLGPTADPETRREGNPAALSAVSDQAFVTLATNDVYCQGALVLGQSLREHRATRRLVVLVTPRVSNPLRYARLTHTRFFRPWSWRRFTAVVRELGPAHAGGPGHLQRALQSLLEQGAPPGTWPTSESLHAKPHGCRIVPCLRYGNQCHCFGVGGSGGR